MLVTFSCKAHENITMFGDVAKRLLKMMGHSGTVPSALSAEEVPVALTRLKQAIEYENNQENKAQSEEEMGEDDSEVSLAHRAFPLIKLLEDAKEAKCNVMWRER